jgi:hypothetical protein
MKRADQNRLDAALLGCLAVAVSGVFFYLVFSSLTW